MKGGEKERGREKQRAIEHRSIDGNDIFF